MRNKRAQTRRVRPGEIIEVTQPPANLPRTDRFVPAHRTHRAELPTVHDAGQYHIQAPQQATQHIEVRTSMTDRAIGHLISHVPMLGFVAILTPILWRWIGISPMTAGFAITLWFVTFSLLWAGSWVVSLLMSAEGIGLISELLKWKLLFREQSYRWQHYDRLTGGDEYDD